MSNVFPFLSIVVYIQLLVLSMICFTCMSLRLNHCWDSVKALQRLEFVLYMCCIHAIAQDFCYHAESTCKSFSGRRIIIKSIESKSHVIIAAQRIFKDDKAKDMSLVFYRNCTHEFAKCLQLNKRIILSGCRRRRILWCFLLAPPHHLGF